MNTYFIQSFGIQRNKRKREIEVDSVEIEIGKGDQILTKIFLL